MTGTEAGIRVYWQQRAFVVGALLAAVPAVLFGVGITLGQIFVPCAAAIALPLFLAGRPDVFRWTCVVIGASLIGFSLMLMGFGMFLFLPSGVLLLLVPGAEAYERPSAARVLLGTGAVLLAGLCAWAAYWYLFVHGQQVA
ncbi:hypothetical protein ACFPM3_17175 [Streptomyces coeruleoprunus]|uniref:Uncharacterized protein n=1 Tax=Streptomyces coeruleoprunus TaxID=285563 RepID=A0ABV9XI81_9ACTN